MTNYPNEAKPLAASFAPLNPLKRCYKEPLGPKPNQELQPCILRRP